MKMLSLGRRDHSRRVGSTLLSRNILRRGGQRLATDCASFCCSLSCPLFLSSRNLSSSSLSSSLPPPPPPPQVDESTRIVMEAAATAPRYVPRSSLKSVSSDGLPVPPPPSSLRSNLYGFYQVLAPPDVEFCFHVDLDTIPEPPPPEAFLTNKKIVLGEGNVFVPSDSEVSDTVFSLQNFVSVIPSYFVPVDELLRDHLVGYTEDHIRMYFAKSRGQQTVTIAGRQYMRIHSGHAQLDMSETVEAEQLFPQYKIVPELAIPYIKCFQGIANRWMPLRMLIERGGKEAAATLPFQGPASLLFFAQLQHIFAFAADNGGAVQLRDANYSRLCADTTPCPRAITKLVGWIEQEKYEMSRVIAELSDQEKAEVLRFFPSLEEGISRHGALFYVDKETGIVMRTRVKEREDIKKLPLEQQLELALQARDKRKIRILRRKIQTRNNPDNPLWDKDNTAREVFGYIPKKGYVTLSTLARKVLPGYLLDFLGNDHIKFFKNYPQYFQIFELREATRWCVARAGAQLPQGVLRTNYTEEELVRIIAAVVQRRGAVPAVRVSLFIPDGCRELIRKHYVSVYHVCAKYPQYFSLTKRSESKNSLTSSIVSLLAMPLEGAHVDADVGLNLADSRVRGETEAEEYVQEESGDGEDGDGGGGE